MRWGSEIEGASRSKAQHSPRAFPGVGTVKNFLRIPPFPGARVKSFFEADGPRDSSSKLCAEVLRHRVGGAFWGRQPQLPADYVLVRSAAALDVAERLANGREILLWPFEEEKSCRAGEPILVTGECDPWHMLSSASALIADPGDELRVIARLLGVQCHLFDRTAGDMGLDGAAAAALLEEALPAQLVVNPFTGVPMSVGETIELCGFWRRLIDSNRDIAGGIGFAFWKQSHVGPLLWDGSAPFGFLRGAREVNDGSRVAIWRAKARAESAANLERRNVALIEVEDGFLRSRGLGADCVPPLSITVDRLGAHFDPSRASELEVLLQDGQFDEPLLARARELRRLIVEAALGKYDRGVGIVQRPAGKRRHILVPGQVEDDRAVQLGGCGLVSNLELLERVREQARDAYIIYKPHPDVLAGHRRGAIAERLCLGHVDEVVSDAPIAPLLDMVDEVHVNTSLAGFEALLRGKTVTTYGVPFYAGWGLTRDLGRVPSRRTARRSIDELVAAALVVYPRYLDPVSGLPCTAEVVVERLSNGEAREDGMIVGVRRLQGRLKYRIRSMVQ